MAAVPVTIDGVLYDLLNKTTQRVVVQGMANITGLAVGGGPVLPDSPEPPIPPEAGDGRWMWVPGTGWVWVPAQPDKPQPFPPSKKR